MPKLNDMTVANRKDQALQVYALKRVNPRMSLVKACAQVGITPDIYYRWITQSDDALDAFQTVLSELQRGSLAQTLAAREAILERLIDDGLSKFTDPLTRLAIYQFLVGHTDELMDNVGVREREAANFLQGPRLVQANSRFTASEVEITIRSRPQDIIDITPT